MMNISCIYGLGTISKIRYKEESAESMILQLIGFFVPKKPINCKLVDLTLFIADFFAQIY